MKKIISKLFKDRRIGYFTIGLTAYCLVAFYLIGHFCRFEWLINSFFGNVAQHKGFGGDLIWGFFLCLICSVAIFALLFAIAIPISIFNQFFPKKNGDNL